MAEREFPTSVRQRGEQSWTNRRPGKKRLSLLLAFSAIDIIAFRNPTRIRTRREKRKSGFCPIFSIPEEEQSIKLAPKEGHERRRSRCFWAATWTLS